MASFAAMLLFCGLCLRIPALQAQTGFRDEFIANLPGTNLICLAVHPDGRIFCGSDLLTNAPSRRITVVRPDGSFDPGFQTDGESVDAVAILPDHGVVAAVRLARNDPQAPIRERLVRFVPDGQREPAFGLMVSNRISSLVSLADGGILVGGDFESVAGKAVRYLARLRPDGALDDTFAPVLTNRVGCVNLQSDGRILIGENTAPAGTAGVVRLNADGTRDFTRLGTDEWIHSIVIRTSGDLVAAGGVTHGGFYRADLRDDSSLGNLIKESDVYWPKRTAEFMSLAIQEGGAIWLGGKFDWYYRQVANLSGGPSSLGRRLIPSALALRSDGSRRCTRSWR